MTQTQTVAESGRVSQQVVTTSVAATSEISYLLDQVASWQANATALLLQITKLNNQTTADAKQISSLQANASSDAAQMTTFQSMITADNDQISSLRSTISADNSTVSADNSTISADSSQIISLEAAATAASNQMRILQGVLSNDDTQVGELETQLAADIAQVSSLSAEVTAFRTPSVSGNFTETTNCPASGNCSYSIEGAYANFGSNAAKNATATFTFYAGPSLTGQTLCTTTVALGNIAGKTIIAIPQTACASSSSTPSQSFGWTFTNS